MSIMMLAMQVPLSVILEAKERSEIFSVSPDSTVLEAVQLMNRERIGCLLVGEPRRAVGIFTERDVLVRVVAAGKEPDGVRVSEVMTSPFVAVRATNTVEEAMRVITTKRCRHLPVQAEDDGIIGLISIGDLTRWTVRDQESQIDGLFEYIAGAYPV